jgi:YgiT-type zinc finger domain-containing protein
LPSESPSAELNLACTACGQPTHAGDVFVTLWLGAELKIVEGVPARVCSHCQTRHYDEDVEAKLDSLVAAGYPDWKITRQMAVPVFAYGEIVDFGATEPRAGANGGASRATAATPVPGDGARMTRGSREELPPPSPPEY